MSVIPHRHITIDYAGNKQYLCAVYSHTIANKLNRAVRHYLESPNKPHRIKEGEEPIFKLTLDEIIQNKKILNLSAADLKAIEDMAPAFLNQNIEKNASQIKNNGVS